MFKNYLKVAFRNLLKNKIYSFINISGLAIGMAVTIMIGLWISDELNYNSYFKNKPHLAQILQNQTNNGETETQIAIPRALEFALRKDFNDNFKHISMASWEQKRYLNFGESTIYKNGIALQEGGPDMFSLEIIEGVKNGLKEKNSIMISESTAKALFGLEAPMGKIIEINNADNMMITGVYKDIPQSNAFNEVDYIVPWKYYITTQKWIEETKDNWGNNSFQAFVQINENTTIEAVTAKIIDIKKKGSPDEAIFNPEMFLFPMEDWHLRGEFENGVQSGGRIENVWLFGIIGAFILFLACINFVNLSTARSEKRAIEVGIRKSIGSKRSQLVFQFLTESFFIVLLSFICAVGIVLLFLNGFNTLADKSIVFPFRKAQFWLLSLVCIIITAVFSGSYPALYLSSFNPVAVLKGTFKSGRYASLPRKVLVVAQFSISISLIIGTLIVMDQIQFSKDRPTGYNKEGLIQIPVMSNQFKGKADLMRNQFIASGAVTEMATTNCPLTDVWSNRGGFTWEGRPENFHADLAYSMVSYEFVETIGAKIIEGRGFSREFPTDSLGVILNKKAVEYMNIKDPIGKFIKDKNPQDPEPPLKIIGVIDDILMKSPYTPIKQAMYVFDYDGNDNFFHLRLNSEKTTSENLKIIESVFKRNFPNTPFDYQFVDEEYGKKFKAEERIASLSRIFTALAIFISCLGLFGLVSFVAEQRTKEIGIRKVLGASVKNLWLLLSVDFIKLVVISLVIASPIAYYMMHEWLQKFEYRVSISISVFLIAIIGALLITLLTVSLQAIKAAVANPSYSLRSE